jgi:drug/metabolite transporter (DMT)-like permease
VQSRGRGCNRKQLPSDDPANGLPWHSRSAAADGAMIDRERPSPSLVPQPVSAAQRALRGIFLMVLASACIAGMHALVRQTTAEIHPFVIAFFRNLTVPIVLAPWLLKAGWTGLRPKRLDLHLWRSAIGVIALLSWFYALSLLPLAEATALNFTSTIFTTVGAALFLGERVRLHRWSAVLIGFAGVLIILQPGREAASLGGVLVLASSAFWAGSLLIAKMVTRHDSTLCVVAWTAVLTMLLSLVPALLVWQTPTLRQFALLLGIGTLGTIGYLFLTQALKEAEATIVLPLDFLRLLWATLFGYLMFGELLDLTTWIGAALIAASAAYIAFREAGQKPASAAARQAELPKLPIE